MGVIPATTGCLRWGVNRVEDPHCLVMRTLSLARDQRWHPRLGQPDTHARACTQAQAGGLCGKGQIQHQVAVQRPRALRASRGPKSLLADTEKDHVSPSRAISVSCLSTFQSFVVLKSELSGIHIPSVLLPMSRLHTLMCREPVMTWNRDSSNILSFGSDAHYGNVLSLLVI